MSTLALLALLSCASGDRAACDDCTGDTAVTEPPMAELFSFVVIADPHVTESNIEHQERLAAAVEWINDNAASEQIELVWVVGDTGWSGGVPIVRALLEGLTTTWVPVLGDNEVHLGAEEAFDDTFRDQYAVLEASMESWSRGTVQTVDPVTGRDMWLQNFAFEYRGIRWLGLDWISREDGILGELAEVHDFPDGTLPFFDGQVSGASGAQDSVLMFSHHPMHLPSFDLAELDKLFGVTAPSGARVAANYAGHYHVSGEEFVEGGDYDVFVTDATWDDENTIRLVRVSGNGLRFEYSQELVVLP